MIYRYDIRWWGTFSSEGPVSSLNYLGKEFRQSEHVVVEPEKRMYAQLYIDVDEKRVDELEWRINVNRVCDMKVVGIDTYDPEGKKLNEIFEEKEELSDSSLDLDGSGSSSILNEPIK